MALRPTISYELAVRGRELAERRLNYLTELYDSGRWIRFHSKTELLSNVRETKAALEVWRRLATGSTNGWRTSSTSAQFAGIKEIISTEFADRQKIQSPSLSLESLIRQQSKYKLDQARKPDRAGRVPAATTDFIFNGGFRT